jgi:hypothetical protein
MKHEVTIISDDCRIEVGNKITLAGIYDEAIVFRSLPARLLKLSFYQRWADFYDVEKVTIALRGSAIGDLDLRAEAKPSQPLKKGGHARIMIAIGPLDVLNQGTLEFQTFMNDESEPQHTHQIFVRTDPHLKIE